MTGVFAFVLVVIFRAEPVGFMVQYNQIKSRKVESLLWKKQYSIL